MFNHCQICSKANENTITRTKATDRPRRRPESRNFTPLNEQEVERLANDIYDVNLEYFPFQTLAEKAAQSEDTLPETPDRPEKTDKV